MSQLFCTSWASSKNSQRKPLFSSFLKQHSFLNPSFSWINGDNLHKEYSFILWKKLSYKDSWSRYIFKSCVVSMVWRLALHIFSLEIINSDGSVCAYQNQRGSWEAESPIFTRSHTFILFQFMSTTSLTVDWPCPGSFLVSLSCHCYSGGVNKSLKVKKWCLW